MIQIYLKTLKSWLKSLNSWSLQKFIPKVDLSQEMNENEIKVKFKKHIAELSKSPVQLLQKGTNRKASRKASRSVEIQNEENNWYEQNTLKKATFGTLF